jgi:hypothetical protein
MSDARDTVGAVLILVGVCAFFPVAAHLTARQDATPGLTYASGDRPREQNAVVCHGQGASFCPPHRMEWTIPAGGSVTTRFTIDGGGRSRLTGSMLLRDACATVVEWEITTQDRTIARNTVRKAWLDEQFLEPEPLGDDRAVTFIARRTDREPCTATLLWYAAGAAKR